MTQQKDAEMRRAESGRRPGEPTVPLSSLWITIMSKETNS